MTERKLLTFYCWETNLFLQMKSLQPAKDLRKSRSPLDKPQGVSTEHENMRARTLSYNY